ncbi:MAG: metallophosphoesterase [Clostridia bacterium]|nr:metallophosphoesterase [Clostridia bacterium]
MRYFIVTDIHGFYTILMKTLTEAGFFDCEVPHKLVILGDYFDRGKEAREMQEFLMKLLEEDRVILIRGNHEDLMMDMLEDFYEIRFDILHGLSHHARNRTFDTALQLTGFGKEEAVRASGAFLYNIKHTPFVRTIIPQSVNYYETEHYVFTHGYLPSYEIGQKHTILPNWRDATEREWYRAKWLNGMKVACIDHSILPDKTIVCGHFHTSYGHSVINKNGKEFDTDAIFDPFYAEGIIALDACTAHSGKMNCIVIDD